MTHYEALYGRRFRSPICWDDVGEHKFLRPEIVQLTVDKVRLIRDRPRTVQSKQKSYADNSRRSLEFQLSPRFIGPFEILERIGEVAYRLALSHSLSRVHDVFHVSILKKFIPNPNHMIQFFDFELNNDLTYKGRPIKIVDLKEQILRRRVIPYAKVQWSNHTEHEATWELESEMREKYSYLF
ncbi:uncharacterized protein LOC120284036 [Dioscorea cayenensis subsp. rotundata]|uniref:Uncharacterized protein LOC120284036 n=1 Tax=Dioscorea cayennensis subsp. rotundata TaxID=55577 RepID=A0AB40D384_DIOCR|nr:uncharacterized protein LOC120284036 [Dioscorea cayenensis subsp. rotundata]